MLWDLSVKNSLKHNFGIIEWTKTNFRGKTCKVIKLGKTVNWKTEEVLKEYKLESGKHKYTVVFY